ncbi:MAG: hypothetical protein JWM59_4419 [Verrucomicrobiales bacterium]|nr:hypothetical protein [Verrucomicrobiales bacterium]
MNQTIKDPEAIPGWGIDANPSNDPAWPIKIRDGARVHSALWNRPPQQAATVEVLVSNEYPHLPAVTGVSSPPSGLSGMLRRWAFRYSESSYGHWLPLMLADRINAFEGIILDVIKGRPPHFMAELGWPAEWRYNRLNLVLRNLLRLVLLAAVIWGIVALCRRHA